MGECSEYFIAGQHAHQLACVNTVGHSFNNLQAEKQRSWTIYTLEDALVVLPSLLHSPFAMLDGLSWHQTFYVPRHTPRGALLTQYSYTPYCQSIVHQYHDLFVTSSLILLLLRQPLEPLNLQYPLQFRWLHRPQSVEDVLSPPFL
jgi:hypothetical protein